jgi:hypothetical protein
VERGTPHCWPLLSVVCCLFVVSSRFSRFAT